MRPGTKWHVEREQGEGGHKRAGGRDREGGTTDTSIKEEGFSPTSEWREGTDRHDLVRSDQRERRTIVSFSE